MTGDPTILTEPIASTILIVTIGSTILIEALDSTIPVEAVGSTIQIGSIASTLLVALSAFAIAYFFLINGTHITITALAIGTLRRQRKRDSHEPIDRSRPNHFLPGVAVIVPAYDEAEVVVDSVTSLLSLEYPSHEVIVVNDGSTDDTRERLVERFEMRRIDAAYPVDLPCEPIRGIYRAPTHDVTLIDKENGGKADALNAGLYFTDQPLFCAVDADSLIERDALKTVVEPFLTNPIETVATGGAVRIANGTTFRKGSPTVVDLPKNHLVRFQAVEYLRAFLLGRIGLSRLGSLLIISGAFGLFRTDVVREIGGYETDSITEDMELIVRLHRHLIDTDRPYDVTFLPRPVVWTEVPQTLSVLGRQRRRWFRGLLDTLLRHRGAIARPSYGVVGLFALPYFVAIEGLGRLIEGFGYLLVPLLFVVGLLDWEFFLAFLLVSVGLGTILTVLGVFGEVFTYRRYDDPRDVAILLWYSLLENVSYRPWRAYVAWRGLFEYVAGNRSWGEMTRVGFEYDSQDRLEYDSKDRLERESKE